MPKRKSDLSRNSKNARARKLARKIETFPQAELRRFKQAERLAAIRVLESPEARSLRRQRHARYMAHKRELKEQRLDEVQREAVISAARTSDFHSSGKVSRQHMEILAQCMEGCPPLAQVPFRSLKGKMEAQKMWEQIANILNTLNKNVFKSWKRWSLYWTDLKRKVRRKYLCMKKCQTEGIQCTVQLNPIEEKVVKLLTDAEGNLLPYSNGDQSSLEPLSGWSQCGRMFIMNLHQTYMRQHGDYYKNNMAIGEHSLRNGRPSSQENGSIEANNFLETEMKLDVDSTEPKKDPIVTVGSRVVVLKREVIEFHLEELRDVSEVDRKEMWELEQ